MPESILKPFRALRPSRELAPKIACPPYDVMNTEEARAYAAGNAQCFFHVSRPEIDLPPGSDEHAEQVYELGRNNLQKFLQHGWLRRDPKPSYYIYRQQLSGHSQVGVVAAASVEAYDHGSIKKHELTRPDKENDRTRHTYTLEASDEPVFLTYRAETAVDASVENVVRTPPEYDFVAQGGVSHTLWVAPSAERPALEAALSRVPVYYIADGHHRIAAASRAKKLLQQDGRAGGESFLAVVFPHDQVRILDYNRVVKDLNGLSADRFIERLSAAFEVDPAQVKKPQSPREFGMYLAGRWYRLVTKASKSSDQSELDVSILQESLLAPILGIADPRVDSRLTFVGGARGAEELERLVNSGEHAVAFRLYPTRVEQMMAIADAGEIMPPKSTWFEPKLLSGLVLNPFG